MPYQVGCDHTVLARQLGDHRAPRLGTPGHSVDQQQRFVAAADVLVSDTIAVQLQILHFTHVKWSPRGVQSLSTLKSGQVKPRRLVSLSLIEADGVAIAGQRPKDQVLDALID